MKRKLFAALVLAGLLVTRPLPPAQASAHASQTTSSATPHSGGRPSARPHHPHHQRHPILAAHHRAYRRRRGHHPVNDGNPRRRHGRALRRRTRHGDADTTSFAGYLPVGDGTRWAMGDDTTLEDPMAATGRSWSATTAPTRTQILVS